MKPACSRFLGDENVNRKVIAALRDRGFDCLVREATVPYTAILERLSGQVSR